MVAPSSSPTSVIQELQNSLRMIYIGIDPGTHTGFAVWDSKERKFLSVETILIHQAFIKILALRDEHPGMIIFIEDARKVSRSGEEERARIQGAGSIKRDCSIWEDFCEDCGILYRFMRPGRGTTKMNPDYFKSLTGWKHRTSNHARDAAMLVFGR